MVLSPSTNQKLTRLDLVGWDGFDTRYAEVPDLPATRCFKNSKRLFLEITILILLPVDVPGLYKSIFTNSQGDLTCPSDQVSAYGGCNIGGSSSINAGLFFEPPASDWDVS